MCVRVLAYARVKRFFLLASFRLYSVCRCFTSSSAHGFMKQLKIVSSSIFLNNVTLLHNFSFISRVRRTFLMWLWEDGREHTVIGKNIYRRRRAIVLFRLTLGLFVRLQLENLRVMGMRVDLG